MLNLNIIENLFADHYKPKDFDCFWNDAKVLPSNKNFDDLKSGLFHVNRDTLMKDTKMIRLKKRKDKSIFLDTVVFGIVFRKQRTETQLDSFIKMVRK